MQKCKGSQLHSSQIVMWRGPRLFLRRLSAKQYPRLRVAIVPQHHAAVWFPGNVQSVNWALSIGERGGKGFFPILSASLLTSLSLLRWFSCFPIPIVHNSRGGFLCKMRLCGAAVPSNVPRSRPVFLFFFFYIFLSLSLGRLADWLGIESENRAMGGFYQTCWNRVMYTHTYNIYIYIHGILFLTCARMHHNKAQDLCFLVPFLPFPPYFIYFPPKPSFVQQFIKLGIEISFFSPLSGSDWPFYLFVTLMLCSLPFRPALLWGQINVLLQLLLHAHFLPSYSFFDFAG